MFSKIKEFLRSLRIRIVLLFSLLLVIFCATAFGLAYKSLVEQLDLRAKNKLHKMSDQLTEFTFRRHEGHLDKHEYEKEKVRAHKEGSFSNKGENHQKRRHDERNRDEEKENRLQKALARFDLFFQQNKSQFNGAVFVVNKQSEILFKFEANQDQAFKIEAFDREFFLNKREGKINGQNYLLHKLPSGDDLLLILNGNEDEELIRAYRGTFLVSLLLFLGLSLACGGIIVGRSLKGIERLRLATEKISNGGYDYRVEIGNDEGKEVEDLASSFNYMTSKTEALIKELKEVTNNIAHDLRTPLTRIRGHAEAQIHTVDIDKKQRASFGLIIDEVDRLVQLIDDMLTLTQAETGSSEKASDEIDLVQSLASLAEVFEFVASDAKIDLSYEAECESAVIVGHSIRLQRALSNLLDNALKYTNSGGSVAVRLQENDGTFTIEFRDTGIGMSTDDCTRIFERFYRCDSSRTTQGNGLGLNLAKAFIEEQGGSLRVKSTEGKGTSFFVDFPQKIV